MPDPCCSALRSSGPSGMQDSSHNNLGNLPYLEAPCSSFLCSMLSSLRRKQVIAKKELQRSLELPYIPSRIRRAHQTTRDQRRTCWRSLSGRPQMRVSKNQGHLTCTLQSWHPSDEDPKNRALFVETHIWSCIGLPCPGRSSEPPPKSVAPPRKVYTPSLTGA